MTDLMSYFNFSSKTFWLGIAMVAAGVWKVAGIDIPGIPDVEMINSFAPEDAATVFKAGFALIFIRKAISATK
jgi:hypothetical protein